MEIGLLQIFGQLQIGGLVSPDLDVEVGPLRDLGVGAIY